MTLPSISVIVTTYNWPQALARVLNGLCAQDYQQVEVIVADDGSKDDTADVVNSFRDKFSFPLIHCWQPDEGFQAAMCRNKAVSKAKNEYLIFLDGDCVPLPHFVGNHARLAERRWFVAGNRILLNESFTKEVLNKQLAIEQWKANRWLIARLFAKCNRIPTRYDMPLGNLRKLSPQKWQGVKTCNLGVWRDDFIAVNGLDENYVGWGLEDSDLIVRLQRHGVKRKLGKFSVEVLHLWHPNNDRTNLSNNEKQFSQVLSSSQVKAQKGIDQYLIYDNS
jgi:glycosyltransferase involved in cell wall biosynthesis